MTCSTASERVRPAASAFGNSSGSTKTMIQARRTPVFSPPCNPLSEMGTLVQTATLRWSAHRAILSTGRTDCTWPPSAQSLRARSSLFPGHPPATAFPAPNPTASHAVAGRGAGLRASSIKVRGSSAYFSLAVDEINNKIDVIASVATLNKNWW